MSQPDRVDFPETTQSSVNVYIHGTQSDGRQEKRKNFVWSDMAPKYFVVLVVLPFLKTNFYLFQDIYIWIFPREGSSCDSLFS